MNIVSSITSTHFQRIIIGFGQSTTDTQLESAIESKSWGAFDKAITRLAERTLESGRKLQFELHVCGDPSTELFNLVFPGFVEWGSLKVVKTLHIGNGSVFHLISLLNRNNSFGPSLFWVLARMACAMARGSFDPRRGRQQSRVLFFGTTTESMAVAIYHPSRQYINHHLIPFSHLPKRDRTR
jgi:hypothetical protein